MNKYIGCKLIEAKEMNLYEYMYNIKGEQCFDENKEGYLVVYDDGYKSWCPREIFENSYLKVDDNKDLPSGVSIGPKMVKDFIKSYEVIERDGKTTIVHATLINGYKLTEASSCVDPVNYNKDIGVEICLKKMENQLWGLLGFLLQTAVGGVK